MKRTTPTTAGSSKGKKKATKEIPVDDGEKQREKKAKVDAALNEIDDLFAVAKTSKKDAAAVAAIQSEDKHLAANDRKLKAHSSSSNSSSSSSSSSGGSSSIEADLPHGLLKSNVPRIIISPEAPVERIDKETGYKVYKAHLLKVGEGGGTANCPFDCDCCF